MSKFDKNFHFNMSPLYVTFIFMIFILWASEAKAEPGIDYDWVVSKEEKCLALNIYHESRSENLAGKYAVADVVLNRVRDDRYPNNICDVIYQGKHKPSWKDPERLVPIRNQCQFSWYCDGKSDDPLDTDSWNESLNIAYHVIKNNKYRGLTEGATHYHTTWVSPYWAPTLQQVGTIGTHIFYRQE
jgi:N-acetylmuramoyl-L-alanine amidase